MKIRLKNFRCYEDQTFDFGNNGLTLLSGPSGKGKTSILLGISFALFGTGTKVVSYGKKSCLVQLEIGDLKIERMKHPNRLIVNDIHEDQSGQDIINRIFGNTFDVTGYIAQNAINSFILMSPVQKLEFLEKFAFKDVDLKKIKGRCKAKITELNEIMLQSIAQLELATNVFSELIKPIHIDFPIKCGKNQHEKVIKNEQVRHKNCYTLIKRSRYTIKETQKELTDILVLKASTTANQENLSSVISKLTGIFVEEENISFEGPEKLLEYRNRLLVLQSRRELILLQDRMKDNMEKLEEMKQAENSEKLKRLEKINASLWKEYTKENLSNTITEFKQCLKDSERIDYLRTKIGEYIVDSEELEIKKSKLEEYRLDFDDKRKTLEILKIQQELYSCPSCDTKLRFKNDKLLFAKEITTIDETIDIETLKSEIFDLNQLIRKFETCIPSEIDKLEKKQKYKREMETLLTSYEDVNKVQTLKDDLEYLHNYESSQNQLEKQKRELELNEQYSSSYISFQKNILKQNYSIKDLEKKCGTNVDELSEEDLRNFINKQEYIMKKIDSLIKRKSDLQEEKEKNIKYLEKINSTHIEKYKEIRIESYLKSIIDEEENKIQEVEGKKVVHEKNLLKIEEYKKNKEEEQNYFKWQEKVIDLQIQEKENRDRYAASTMLKDKILEAESLAMLNIISSINTHAQIYLDCFFSDNPIIAHLVTFKVTKKSTKPQINIEIEYKDMECDLSMLSGGELSRVILAYTLALGEMFNIPLLLLDECTANLDQDLSTSIFNSVRQHFTGKLVIIIAHQVVTGAFDREINLEEHE
jgi:DNA repair exonuclease SbcCD ATPase subunit